MAAQGRCHFARDYSCAAFGASTLSAPSSAAAAFMLQTMQAEGAGFHQPGIGYEPVTGMTYDGHPLAYGNGTLYGTPHEFSAPSKESLHVAMLARALEGSDLASAFTGGLNASLSLLSRKMSAYEQFNASYPGFGCFLPWVSVTSSGLQPIAPGWTHAVPGLDNGEWFWSMMAAAAALDTVGDAALARRYHAWTDCMIANARTIFYAGEGKVAAVVQIADPSAPVTPGNYNQTGGGLLDDPYEGETLTVLLDALTPWTNASERELLWSVKRPQLRSVNYVLPSGRAITVQQGFWFSSHEQWKTLLLPYFDVDIVRRVFANCERARTWDGSVTALPGLLASVNDVTNGSESIPDYVSAAGIQSIASQTVLRRDLVTPYGAWPVMAHNLTAGLCWYRNMLAAPRMQGPHGSTEAISVNGTEISPLTTWDSKVTTLLSMVGGVSDSVRAVLRRLPDATRRTRSAYDRFTQVMLRALSTVWRGAVGGVEFAFRPQPASILIGILGSVLIALFSMWMVSRRQFRQSARELLVSAGAVDATPASGLAKRSWSVVVGAVAIVAAVAILAFSGQASPG
ncbi:hypothetical protein EON62_02815, partial [archaeon]